MSKLFWASFFILLASLVSAQEKKIITNFKHLEVKNGLPENDIKGFISDEQNGYWLRTNSFIVYYNGHEFITYGKNRGLFSISTSAIKSFNIQDKFIHVFGDSSVDRINRINKKSEQLFKDTTGIGIKAGFFTRQGFLIIVFNNGDICHLQKGKLKKIHQLKIYAFCEIIETKEGDILISNVNKDIAVFSSNLNLLKHVKFLEPVLLNGFMQNTEDLGTIIGANFRSFTYNKSTHNFVPLKFDHTLGRLFYHDNDQNYTVIGFNNVSQHDLKINRSISIDITLNYNYFINKIAVDKNRNLILCTNQGLILYKTPYAFLSYPFPKALMNPRYNTTRRAILEKPDKKIIFVSYGHMDEYDPISGYTRPFSSDNVDGYSAYLTNKELWLGSDGTGLYRIDQKTRRAKGDTSYISLFDQPNMHITTISKFDDDHLLLGLSGSSCNLKLYNVQKKKYSELLLEGWKSSRLTDKVNAVIEDSVSKWICTAGGLLELINGNKVRFYLNATNLGTNVVNYVFRESETVLWIATDIGILKYDRKLKKIVQKISENEGLSGNKCISILPDAYNTFWVPTYTGLSRIDRQTGRIWNYFMQDGFTDNEYNYASYLKASTGDIYLGGLNGFVRVRPSPPQENENIIAGIHLDYAILNRKNGKELLDISNTKSLQMHEYADRLSIPFSVNEHLSSEYVRYYYKIDGLHSDWIPLERQNKIDLEFLPAGSYNMHVRSAVLENRNTFYQLAIPLVVTEYWYDTKWFYFIIILSALLILMGFIYYRYSTIREIETIRTSLTNDIHDEIGTMLTKAIMRLELIRKKGLYDDTALFKVEKHLRNTIQSFRNVLWSLNTDNTSIDDLVGRLNTMLNDIFDGTKFQFLVTSLSPDVNFEKSIYIKRNLLLIIKELAHNAIKHSNGNFFEVVIRKEGVKWKILITDNGTNKNIGILEKGVGLSSITKRVATINGKIDVEMREDGFVTIIYI